MSRSERRAAKSRRQQPRFAYCLTSGRGFNDIPRSSLKGRDGTPKSDIGVNVYVEINGRKISHT